MSTFFKIKFLIVLLFSFLFSWSIQIQSEEAPITKRLQLERSVEKELEQTCIFIRNCIALKIIYETSIICVTLLSSLYSKRFQKEAFSPKLSQVKFQRIKPEKNQFIQTEQQKNVIRILQNYFPVSNTETGDYIIKPIPKELIDSWGVELPQGFLLYGLPGTGKTSYAKKIATAFDASFASIKCSDISHHLQGVAEKNVNHIFDVIAIEAKKNEPIVIFFDEFDSLATARESFLYEGSSKTDILNLLLEKFQDIRSCKNVILCVATNRPEVLDKAIKRGERLDMKIEFPVPGRESREQFINSLLPQFEDSTKLVNTLVTKTNGNGYADIKADINNAKWNAILEGKQILELKHFNFQAV